MAFRKKRNAAQMAYQARQLRDRRKAERAELKAAKRLARPGSRSDWIESIPQDLEA